MPFVSIIIPVYNCSRYLPDCLNSVLAQSFRNFEVVIVDDGSDDDSLSICHSYAKHNPSIKVFHQENAGASAARNYGIDMAEGKWCCFVDADDFVKEDYILCLVSHISMDSSLVISNVEYCSGVTVPDYEDADCAGIDLIRDYIWNNGIACHLGPYSKLFNCQILNEKNVRFPANVTNGEDSMFVFEYLTHVEMLSAFESRNYVYRDVPGSLSKKTVPEREALYNFIRQRRAWLRFMDFSASDSRAWKNSSLPFFFNRYLYSLFADRTVSFQYCLLQVRKYEEDILAMFTYSIYRTSFTGLISVFLLSCHLRVIYVLYNYLFVRFYLKIMVG